MTKANACHAIQTFLILALSLVNASAQESRRDARQSSPRQDSQPVGVQDEENSEQSRWDAIKNGSEPEEYKTFLAKYPRGYYAEAARSRLRKLLGEDFVALVMKHVDANMRWLGVEEQLGRRAALLPKLYEALLAAGVQEQEFFGQVAETRSRLLNAMNAAPRGDGDAKTPDQKRSVIEADNNLDQTLKLLDALLENYPQLCSNEMFLKVWDELAGAQNRIAVTRTDYNAAVSEYHTMRDEPGMVRLAEQHGFTPEPYFKTEQGRPVEPNIKIVPLVSIPASQRIWMWKRII